MLDYQAEAINRVREYVRTKDAEHMAIVENFCKPLEVDISALTDRVLQSPITINFHPDRF